jgi:signal transduction histidine kinase
MLRRVGDSLDAESLADVGRIQDAAARMQQLIEDLLGYARVTSRAQPFARVDLGDVCRDVLQNLEARIEETGATVTIGQMPVLDADASQMRQLFQNLIGNALKFQPPGRAPTVTVTATEIPAAGPTETSRWRLDVADNGIGIEARHADRIFAPFERLHSRTEYAGTGIGLAIVRKIAERHGGEITLTSHPGDGTTFHVTLPVHQPSAATPAGTAPSAATPEESVNAQR